MATVLERFKVLGLGHSKPILSKAGELVRECWDAQKNLAPPIVIQEEDGKKIQVNDYPDFFSSSIDRVIILFLKDSEGLRNG